MGLFNRLFGYRWSLYLVIDGNNAQYVMHENSVMRMLGSVTHYFANGALPVEPWSIHLSFNRTKKTIKLESSHFTKDGENPTERLITAIKSLDPGWMVKGDKPVFMEIKTKKQIPITNNLPLETSSDIQNLIDQGFSIPENITFHSIMKSIFSN